jgi:hypothetical protein
MLVRAGGVVAVMNDELRAVQRRLGPTQRPAQDVLERLESVPAGGGQRADREMGKMGELDLLGAP